MASKVNLEHSVSCVLIRIYFISIDNHFDHAKNFCHHLQFHSAHATRFYEPEFAEFDVCTETLDPQNKCVLLRLRVHNRRKKWNFPLNFRTMRKLSELYSRIFQTQSSGCVSGLDHIRNFTNLKILNI